MVINMCVTLDIGEKKIASDDTIGLRRRELPGQFARGVSGIRRGDNDSSETYITRVRGRVSTWLK